MNTPAPILKAAARARRQKRLHARAIAAPIVADAYAFDGPAIAEDATPPPFDPPDVLDDFVADQEPPFDPPANENEPVLATAPRHEAIEIASAADWPEEAAAVIGEQPSPPPLRFAPCLTIHACWDRPEAGARFNDLANDARLARIVLTIAHGGLESAIANFSDATAPDLILIDTTLKANQLLAAIERLRARVGGETKLIILGGVNDVDLLRRLALLGVSDYLLELPAAGDLATRICALFAETDSARVIAVMGASGGVGASTIARNLAWSIAARQETPAALVDLDLSHGTAAFSFHRAPPLSVADALRDPDAVDDALLERMALCPRPLLRVVPAPASPETAFEPWPRAVERVVGETRRMSRYVVLDVPNVWAPWVKDTLLRADAVILVAAPDLASLRNAKNLLDILKSERPPGCEPLVALSMTGAPKRPEIMFKEFAEALGETPVISVPFDPALIGMCEISGRMAGELSPQAKAALAFDSLATILTGREPVRQNQVKPDLVLTKRAPVVRRVEADTPRQRTRPHIAAAAALALLIVGGGWLLRGSAAPVPEAAHAAMTYR